MASKSGCKWLQNYIHNRSNVYNICFATWFLESPASEKLWYINSVKWLSNLTLPHYVSYSFAYIALS